MPIGPGFVLAERYKLIEQLGAGGMGSVWRAEDRKLGSEVAVKLIDARHAQSPEILARFRREAQVAAAIRSTYVVQILDYGTEDECGSSFIAMELLQGETLATRLEREGRLDPWSVAHLLGHVGRALSLAHEKGIVHRDLKPENVFLVQEGDEELAKVLDFGIARWREAVTDVSDVKTLAGILIGTPYYMSPEQASGQTADHQSDIWAYGAIAFECLTGVRPYQGDSLGILFHEICTGEQPVPSRLAEVPPGFDAWFVRANARAKSLRFASIREAWEQLRRVCGGAAMKLPVAVVLDETVDAHVTMAKTVRSAQAPKIQQSDQTLAAQASPPPLVRDDSPDGDGRLRPAVQAVSARADSNNATPSSFGYEVSSRELLPSASRITPTGTILPQRRASRKAGRSVRTRNTSRSSTRLALPAVLAVVLALGALGASDAKSRLVKPHALELKGSAPIALNTPVAAMPAASATTSCATPSPSAQLLAALAISPIQAEPCLGDLGPFAQAESTCAAATDPEGARASHPLNFEVSHAIGSPVEVTVFGHAPVSTPALSPPITPAVTPSSIADARDPRLSPEHPLRTDPIHPVVSTTGVSNPPAPLPPAKRPANVGAAESAKARVAASSDRRVQVASDSGRGRGSAELGDRNAAGF